MTATESTCHPRTLIAPAILAILALACTGCAGPRGSGELRVEARGAQRARLNTNFDTAVYHPNDHNVASFYLTNANVEELLEGKIDEGQIVHIELLWNPIAGRTPLDESAANISVRHIIITGGQAGVYGGAGFATASGDVGEDTIKLSIPDATLSLLDSTPGFADMLSPALLIGDVKAVHDPSLAKKLGLAASQVVTNMLRKPQYVRAD